MGMKKEKIREMRKREQESGGKEMKDGGMVLGLVRTIATTRMPSRAAWRLVAASVAGERRVKV